MKKEAVSAGFYQSLSWNTKHSRLQILTIKELLQGTTIDMPLLRHTSVTYRQAPRRQRDDKDREQRETQN